MSAPQINDRHAEYNFTKLFVISCLALATAGFGFIIRTQIAEDLRMEFFDPIDKLHSGEMIGACLGVAFLGFALTIPIGSSLLDALGMGFLLRLSSVCFILGPGLIIFAGKSQALFPAMGGHPPVYWALWVGMLIAGIAWGLVETVINPLCATLYPHDKTHKLNVLHAWWPGGLIVGGLAGQLLLGLHMSWQLKYGVALLPAALFGLLTLGTKFPPTERAASGVPAKAMFKEILKPFFILWFLSMWLTAASELAPGQWVDMTLTRTVGFQGVWLLIYVSGLMFVMRHFAGALAHKLSPVGVLWVSCLLASVGLVLLSTANNLVVGLVAATVWGTGVCYMWPTMLAAVSERFPRSGAVGIGLMGCAGTLTSFFFLPKMGQVFDMVKVRAAGGEPIPGAVTAMVQTFTGGGDPLPASKATFDAISAAASNPAAADHAAQLAKLNEYLTTASSVSFRSVAILPAILLLSFGAIWLYDRAKGGYKAVSIEQANAVAAELNGEAK